MDMQNANFTGNCRLLRIKGKSVPFVLKLILDNSTLFPIFEPAIISMSNIFVYTPYVIIKIKFLLLKKILVNLL